MSTAPSAERTALRERQANASESGLSVRDLSVVYRNGHVALDNISFEIPTATICALVGNNGAGKSTLFKTIMGLLPAAKGQVCLRGVCVNSQQSHAQVAYVPQSEEVDWNFPVRVLDVVMMGRYGHMSFLRRPRAVDRQAVDAALDMVGLSEYRHRQIGMLSGGQRKRVFLARALAQGANTLLLDEPFTGVDLNTENEIIELLKTLRDQGCLILVSTHNLGSVPQFCDQSVLINRHLVAFGPTETVFTQHNLAEAFGGNLRFHVLAGHDLHDDDDQRRVTVISDDERPVVLYGDEQSEAVQQAKTDEPSPPGEGSSG